MRIRRPRRRREVARLRPAPFRRRSGRRGAARPARLARTWMRTRPARGACSSRRSTRRSPHPRTWWNHRARAALRSRRAVRTGRRRRSGCDRRPSGRHRDGDWCRESRERRPRARRRPRRAPSTARIQTGRRRERDREGGGGRELSPRHVSSYASANISSKPERKQSTSTSGSGTAVVSITMPMQHNSQCEISVTLNAEPEGGPNA